MNTITINFVPCIPPPTGGFRVRYRIVGDTDFIEIGPFTESPIIFEAEGPPCSDYEGFLFSDCGGGKIGDELPWSVGCAPASVSVSEPPPDNVLVINGAGGYIIHSVANLAGYTLPGDLTTGNIDGGQHTQNGSTGICLNITIGGVPAHLSLYVNDVLIQCIANVDLTGSDCFNGTAIVPGDNVRIELIVGATC